jgi:uncharacterized protein
LLDGGNIMDLPIAIDYSQLEQLCEHYRIRKFSLFGSVLRDDFTPTSDIDVLVEFEPSAHTTYFDMVEIQDKLTALLKRKVDLLTPKALSPYFREDVLREAQTLYERE